MNIVYNLNPDTGLMRLEFKKDIITDDDLLMKFENYVLPILAANDKFLLTGSLSLKLLGFEPMDKVGDFDFGLTDEFTEDEYDTLKNLFGLVNVKHNGYWWDDAEKKAKFDPKVHMFQLYKEWSEQVDNSDLYRQIDFKIDVFNDEFIKLKDIITVYYKDFELKLVHPSITYSYRMRYALDIRSKTTYKYWERMKSFMDDAKSYYHNLRAIQKMQMRIEEHNANVKNDNEKLDKIKALITRRDNNAYTFLNKLLEDENNSNRRYTW
jgi:hypothetical protein